MLSAQTTRTVRATLPAVGAAIGDIADLFYKKMFAAHPELLRDLFNRGNQADGSQRQALAGSIAAFATALVEHPDVRPDAMLARIAHKHASLGITRDQYTIVHTHLFEAIVDVLGEAVTPDVARAWDEVYWLMANALIAIEERLYAEAGAVDGSTWRTWEIVERVQETADVATFRLSPCAGDEVPGFRPGQYVSVQVELPDGARQIRQYSLSAAPAETLSITVKRVHGVPEGEVSNHLHAHGHVGSRLTLSAPYGDVPPVDDAAPLLLISAGIGCTPIVAMLDHLVRVDHAGPVTVLHADRSPAEHALRARHTRLADELAPGAVHFWYESAGAEDVPATRRGRMELTDITIPTGARAYLCGPLPFMRGVRARLIELGVRPADIHYEVFGPDLWLGGE